MVQAIELKLLVAAGALGLVQIHWAALSARLQQTFAWGASARDEPRPITGVAARLDRAFDNFNETFPIYASAVLAAALASKLGALTLWGSVLYLTGRALYVPLYAAGVPYARTAVWQIATIGIVMIGAALFV